MKIVKTYTQQLPEFRFIGIKYGDSDRVNGNFGAKWGEWFRKGRFEILQKAIGEQSFFEDSSAYIGLMRGKEGEPFVYAIGMFAPVGTQPPEGMEYIDFPAVKVGIGWVCGNEESGELYCNEDEVVAEMKKNGVVPTADEEGAYWYFERYACPRFTSPDEDGNVILDVGFFTK